MSGSCISSGKLTNNGEKLLEISDILESKIISLDIYNVPLSKGILMDSLRGVGQILQPFVHPALSPTLCHIAIKLNLENVNDIIILEYGQYITEETDNKSKGKIKSGSGSLFNEPRKEINNFKYYYINTDGVRITRINNSETLDSQYIADVIGIGLRYFNPVSFLAAAFPIVILFQPFISGANLAKIISCNVKNQITLKNLINRIKSEKWLAKNYNLLNNNCQDFAAEIILILQAVRINEKNKIRLIEKSSLPNCLIKALTKNEGSNLHNIIGRIPVVGLFHDLIYYNIK